MSSENNLLFEWGQIRHMEEFLITETQRLISQFSFFWKQFRYSNHYKRWN